jgi:NAD(P)-dependent dehydrogenase (short-subunit alcohol dehydrogenase family)
MAVVAVVTGAASGMGRACARRLAPACDHLVLADLADVDVSGIDAAGDVQVVRCDVADPSDVADLAACAGDTDGVRWLVHAAGVSPSMGDAARMFTVDLVGTVRVVAAFEPVMARGGAAVLFASMAPHLLATGSDPDLDAILVDPLADAAAARFATAPAIAGDPAMAYAWAKRGVMRLAAARAAAWASRGARINTVSPGSIDTPMGRQELAVQPAMRSMLDRTPAGRLGREDDIAAAVEFLLSDDATYITGTDLLVDGGLMATITS